MFIVCFCSSEVSSAIEESTLRLAAFLKTHCVGSDAVPHVKMLQGITGLAKGPIGRKEVAAHMTESWATAREALDNFIGDAKLKNNSALKALLVAKYEYLSGIDETWKLDDALLNQLGGGESGKDFLLSRLADGLPTGAVIKTCSQVQPHNFLKLV